MLSTMSLYDPCLPTADGMAPVNFEYECACAFWCFDMRLLSHWLARAFEEHSACQPSAFSEFLITFATNNLPTANDKMSIQVKIDGYVECLALLFSLGVPAQPL